MATTFDGPYQANGHTHDHTHKHSRHQHSHKRHGTEQSLNGSFSITMPQETNRFAARNENDFAFKNNSIPNGHHENRFEDQNVHKHDHHDHDHTHSHSFHAGPLQELQYTNGVVHAVTPPRQTDMHNHTYNHRRPESLSIKPAYVGQEQSDDTKLMLTQTISTRR